MVGSTFGPASAVLEPIKPFPLALAMEACEPFIQHIRWQLDLRLEPDLHRDGKGGDKLVEILAYAAARLENFG